MNKFKLALSAGALMLGIGSSFATAHQAFANKKWGKDAATGIYTEVTGLSQGTDYRCRASSNICTEEYPSDVDPNNQAADTHPGTVAPVNTVLGTFSL